MRTRIFIAALLLSLPLAFLWGQAGGPDPAAAAKGKGKGRGNAAKQPSPLGANLPMGGVTRVEQRLLEQ